VPGRIAHRILIPLASRCFLNRACFQERTEKENTMKIIRDVMSRDVAVVTPSASIHEVAKKMETQGIGCVIVVKDDRLVGMITDRDIALRCVAQAHDAAGTTAESIMTPEILYCKETDTVDDVARNMGKNKIRRLPVLSKDKRMVGIVTLGDLAAHSNHVLCGETLGKICKRAA
jgi:CBS domain-containing protein